VIVRYLHKPEGLLRSTLEDWGICLDETRSPARVLNDCARQFPGWLVNSGPARSVELFSVCFSGGGLISPMPVWMSKAHFEREIRARLEGVETALDVGAGTGRFSLWLAARRVRVTHLDVSAGMIERAHRDAVEAGVAERMTFRQGRLADIGGYAPGQFDLVICSDAPVSYVYLSTPRRSNRWCACAGRPLW
jgi:SAM-dependent methyltransferase